MSQTDERKEFLLKFYEACWDNITRAEDDAWKMFAAYTAIFAGLALAFRTIGLVGFLSIMTIFSFLAIALSLNANLWFVRNIGLISNLEQEFLLDSDYGVLVPQSYKKKIPFFSRDVFEAWWVLNAGYLGISLTLMVILLPKIVSCNGKLFVLVIYLVSSILTIWYGDFLNKRHKKFVDAAVGKYLKMSHQDSDKGDNKNPLGQQTRKTA